MLISSGTKKPNVHAGVYVAPTAVLSGDVTVEEGCAILYGVVVTAEGAPVTIGANTVVMENAVLKSSGGSVMQFPLSIGESCIIGPGAYVVGATIEPGCFIAAHEIRPQRRDHRRERYGRRGRQDVFYGRLQPGCVGGSPRARCRDVLEIPAEDPRAGRADRGSAEKGRACETTQTHRGTASGAKRRSGESRGRHVRRVGRSAPSP